MKKDNKKTHKAPAMAAKAHNTSKEAPKEDTKTAPAPEKAGTKRSFK